MRTSVIFLLLFALVMTAQCQVLEAEDGALSGTQKSTARAGYSGTGFVTGFDADGDKVTMTKNAALAGIYNLFITYAAPSGDKLNFIYVNNQNIGNVSFPLATTFNETLAGKIYLKQGANTIAIVKDWGYFDVDNIRLEKTEAADFNNIAANLITPSPSEEADSLYEFLSKVYGKVILSGQYGGATELTRIATVSTKTPLICGFDMMDYSPSRVAFGASSTEAEKSIEWYQQKGIVTFAWHWNAPKDLINQPPDKLWWSGFYTNATTFDVTKAMNDETSEEYSLIIRDIDAIAVQLTKLRDAHVPVLWRPLHEAEGKWFWWGAKGADPCKWLWKLLFDRLVNHHQLNNLIWVWTSTATADALNWYPGDAYVDVIGADIYLPAGNYSSNFVAFDNMVSLYEGKKIIALSENGPIPDGESLFQEGAAWSWFSTWGGDFITNGVYNSPTHINTVFNHDYVITKDEVNDIDAIIAALEARKDDDETILGVDEQLSSIYYKNPIRDNFTLTFREPSTRKVIIYNANGKAEFSSTETGTQLNIDFKNKSAGVYFLKIVTSKSTEVYRIIKIE